MKRKKKTIIAICSIAFALTLAVGTMLFDSKGQNIARAEIIFPENEEIKKEYSLGEKLLMPTPDVVTIKVGNEFIKATESMLLFPDGTSKIGGNYELSQCGNYVATYYTADTDKSVEYTFTVYKNNYYIPSTSSVEWTESLSLVPNKSGIEVDLKEGDSFSYNKKINLNDYEGELLDICRIYPDIREKSTEMPKVSHVTVKVVDCYDPTKFVEIYAWKDSSKGYVYCGAGASTQELTSLEKDAGKANLKYEGEDYYFRTSKRYKAEGTYGNWIYGSVTEELVNFGGIGFVWDLRSYKIYANQRKFGDYLITDLNAPELYGDNVLDIQEFFTTGEVYFNLECYNYNAASINIGIESIFGLTGEELKDARIVDDVAPIIEVHAVKTNEKGVIVAKDVPYTLPTEVSVYDFNTYGTVKTAVYRNYGTPAQTTCFVQDGTFIPTQTGWYTVAYAVEDGYGNKSVQTLNLKCVEGEVFTYEQDKLNSLLAVKNNAIPAISVTGLNLDVKTTVMVTNPKGECETLIYNEADNCYYYMPKFLGEYEVKYLFADNVYQQEYSYKVNVTQENNVLFKDTPKFPWYFIKNANYTLQDYYAYTATEEGLSAHLTETEISVDKTAYQKLSASQRLNYKIEGIESIKFRFSYGGESFETEEYPILDLKFGEKTYYKDGEGVEHSRPYAEYWQGDYESYAYTSNSIDYSFAESSADQFMDFVNLLSLAKFKLNYAVSGKFGSVSIILQDSGSPEENKIIITQSASAKGIQYTATTYKDGNLTESVITEQASATYQVYYSAGKIYYGDGLSVMAPVFTSDLMVLSVGFEDVEETSIFTVREISNQRFCAPNRMMEINPECSFTYLKGSIPYGSDCVINLATVYSVLSPATNANLTVTVTDENGNFMTAKDGTVLKSADGNKTYVVHFATCGQYKVKYDFSVRGSNNRGSIELAAVNQYYILNVTDFIPPTAQFADGFNENTVMEISVGTIHTLKKVFVNDNISMENEISIYMMVLNENFTLVRGGYNVKEYTFTEKGNYIVQAWVFDSEGNSTKIYYRVEVR